MEASCTWQFLVHRLIAAWSCYGAYEIVRVVIIGLLKYLFVPVSVHCGCTFVISLYGDVFFYVSTFLLPSYRMPMTSLLYMECLGSFGSLYSFKCVYKYFPSVSNSAVFMPLEAGSRLAPKTGTMPAQFRRNRISRNSQVAIWMEIRKIL